MITVDEALIPLYWAAQGNYVASASHTCVKQYAVKFAKQAPPPFVKDGLPRQVGGNGKNRTFT